MPCSYCAQSGHNITTCPRRITKVYHAEIETETELALARRTTELAHAAVAAERVSLERDKARFAAEIESERARAHERFIALCFVFREEVGVLRTLWDTIRSQDRLIAEGRAYVAQLTSSAKDATRETLMLTNMETERNSLVTRGEAVMADITHRSGGKLQIDAIDGELVTLPGAT